ncbi:hypothetical protein L484_001992 [Morus notabilis]|uniref:Uncharacterized protein n=1 Tax=Morus notabilis TaxID=981085 RepID=W9S287_9ROSA|nr:uncharacterized protein LOC21385573 [Morus notabilis]EXB83384.1 hypothetical protein L484_001992 [Morus notabilis]
MGNCLRSNYNKVLAEDIDKQEPPKELAKASFTTTPHVKDVRRNKNRVRLRLQEGNNIGNSSETNSGVVRIKLVVTQEELKQILNYKSRSGSNFSSVEQLLSEMKIVRGRSVSEVDKSDHGTIVHGSWSPTLESIPEDI